MPLPTLAHPPLVVDPKRTYSIEEWQLIEEATGRRYEYHEGRLMLVESMAGGTGMHAPIGGNLIGATWTLVRSVPKSNGASASARCGVYTSDLRVMIESDRRYVYPDAAVICGRPYYDSVVQTAVRNPLLVAEVMSPSSERYDTTEKFDYYSSLETLRHYLLVSQDMPRVEVKTRESAGANWVSSVGNGMDAEVEIPSLGGKLSLAEVYWLVIWGE